MSQFDTREIEMDEIESTEKNKKEKEIISSFQRE